MSRRNPNWPAWVEELKKSGIERTGFRSNPKWRTLNAKCNQIQRRLNSVARTEAVDAEVAKVKAEKTPSRLVNPAGKPALLD
ncbi:MAG: hypothetical protein U0872_04725 [Planctomycetaceae bacterium]